MIDRLDYVALNTPAITSMAAAKDKMTSIEKGLRALVELRVSQVNGCVYCVYLHSGQARDAGETQQRLDCLPVWRECLFFEDHEQAAFDWAEAVTLVSEGGAPKALYQALFEHFTDIQVVDLTLFIAQMNAWNRLAISFGHTPELRGQ